MYRITIQARNELNSNKIACNCNMFIFVHSNQSFNYICLSPAAFHKDVFCNHTNCFKEMVDSYQKHVIHGSALERCRIK